MLYQLHQEVNFIKLKIKAVGISYPAISQATSIPVPKIKKLMTGRQEMTLSERDLLCRYLDIPLFELTNPRIAKLIKSGLLTDISRLNQSQIDAILEIVRLFIKSK